MNRTTALAIALTGLSIHAPLVRAQDELPEEQAAREPVRDAAVRAELDLPRITREADPIAPVQDESLEPVQPGLTGGRDWLEGLALSNADLPRAALLPERIFLRERRGTIWKGPSGLWIFLPDAEGRLPGEGAMILAPNGVLDRLSASLEGLPTPAAIQVSGETLLYHDHNYLLLSDYTRSFAPGGAESPSQTPPGQQSDPEVEELIADLQGESRAGSRRNEALRERLRAAEHARGRSSQTGEQGGRPPLVSDGTYLSQRRARLDRSANGEWTLSFDNDADSLGDAPLIVLPCRTLMRMEARVGSNARTTMIVSGRVYTYDGAGYILPTMFAVEFDGDVRPMQ